MGLQEGQNVISAAGKATAKAITTWKWWRPGLIVGTTLFVAFAAVPVFLQLRFGVWGGFTYELSPFVDDSLARRFLLPGLGVLVGAFVIAVLFRLATEIVRLARSQR